MAIIGLILTALGIAFAFWARYSLGQNWSSKVTIKVEHELIRNGPYAYVRHPIYTGILLALVGTALAIAEWRAVIAPSQNTAGAPASFCRGLSPKAL